MDEHEITVEHVLKRAVDVALSNLYTALTGQYAITAITQGTTKVLIQPSEVTQEMLSPETIELANEYTNFVNAYEHNYENSGYSPHEMEMLRTLKHNELLAALQTDGVNVSDRAATTELARKIQTWMRE